MADDIPSEAKSWVEKMATFPHAFTTEEIHRAIEIHNDMHRTWSDSGLAWNEFMDILLKARRDVEIANGE